MPSRSWWQTGVVYQIYPRSFADSDGDGTGDLRGVISRLDYLNDGTPRSLGVDAIWLSPFFPSPGLDFGYDVSDYCGIDPLFGTMADFDTLVAEAHRRGIRIVLDLVLNHTSHLHPWFVESRGARESPKRDWYIWQDPGRLGGVPNNWQSVFGGNAWKWDARTRQYYFHMFLEQQPDINWRNPIVRQSVMDVFRFWLDRGVDGFRLDVVNGYFKDLMLRNNPPALGIRGYERQRHIYDKDQPELLGVYREIRSILDSYGERMAVGEIMGGKAEAARYCKDGLLPLAFNFEFTHQGWSPRGFLRSIEGFERALAGEGWPCYVLSNHDIVRHASRYGGRWPAARAKVAAAMLLTLRGTPFLYHGEEIGMREGMIRRAELQDPPGKRYWPFYKGRDGCRTPIPWNASTGAGFTTGKPWLPINSDYRQVNVEAQRDDPDSVLSFYRKMIWLRKKTPALQTGDFVSITVGSDRALVYLRETKSQRVLVALNFFEAPCDIRIGSTDLQGSWRVLLSSKRETNLQPVSNIIRLGPHEAAIWELK
ncbi:MAG: alpha-amylase family glycosyl hydrolase [Anaerolineales bacterium]